jgi:raffinose synthase
MFEIQNGKLISNGVEILISLPKGITIERDANIPESGTFLTFSKDAPFAVAYWDGIKISKLRRFTALYHIEPFWLSPTFGTKEKNIPSHTAAMWIERRDNFKVVIIPIINKGYRAFIRGNNHGLSLMVDNNCKIGKMNQVTALYIGIADDPYHMMEDAAKNISQHINVGKLRVEKKLPEWIDKLGYCTWNTFGQSVNESKLIEMLRAYKKAGIVPRYVLLDDGWQKKFIISLLNRGVNSRKFPAGLKKLVELCKSKFKVEVFLVWHTFQGYWGGIHIRGGYSKKFKNSLFRVKPHCGPSFPKTGNLGIMLYKLTTKELISLVSGSGTMLPEKMGEFYYDYHDWLRSQGVDGVKVDNQSGMSHFAYNLGYQADLMRDYHKVLEDSVTKHFSESSIINCMSMGNDVIFQTVKSNITRNSQDYFPKRNAWQVNHVVFNSYNDFFTGQFVHPDWDMFQTANKLGWGAYQAASRVISGSPIYVSDDFAEVDGKILKKIALPNGRILRCESIALPTRDCLFQNPAKPRRALKIFNHNKYNSILGIFNVMLKHSTIINFSPSDIYGINEGNYAIFNFNDGHLETINAKEDSVLLLDVKGFVVYTLALIENGFAPIGIVSMYNSGGIFESIENLGSKISIRLKYGGLIGFYSEKKPNKVLINGEDYDFLYDSASNFLKVSVPMKEDQSLEIFF